MQDIPIEPVRGRPVAAETTTGPNGLSRTLILALGTFAVGTDAFVLAGFLPDLAAELDVPTATAGWAVTAFAAAYALGSPLLATATARVPRRALLVTALIVLGVANLASAVATTFWLLLATRVLAAVGAAAFTPNAGAVASALVRPEARARALAVVVGGLTIATALGVPLSDVLGEWLGWRSALAAVAALCLLAAAGVAAWVPSVPAGPRIPLAARLSVLRNRTVAATLPLTTLGMAAAYVVYAYAVPAFEALGIAPSSTAWVLALYGVGAVGGSLSSGYVTDRWGATRLLTVGYLVMAAALAIMGALAATHAQVASLAGPLAAAWGAASWCQTPAQQHRLIEAAPQEAGLVVALNASCIYLGIGAGTLLGGIAIGRGAGTMYFLGAALAAASVVYLRATAKRVTPGPLAPVPASGRP
ncbi:MFS transporter [Streptomyces millisiae]|uniref:MFS transporter n=1 Tax=Streptomyces millisiae TaxID=3075542 RepID=A0ABU2LHL3_9ACTN|nr:MFS transporter [Streptomyces sp. DSM 44918]MDT0317074.1 MFS transporter [Streptomyces sp. DSM 44918]